MDTPAQQEMLDMYIAAIVLDYKNMLAHKPVSLAAKWFPTEGSAIDREHDAVMKFSQNMNYAPASIRKTMITPLRRYIGVCESMMSRNQWNNINYNRQNSCNFKNRSVFMKKDPEKFSEWLKTKNTTQYSETEPVKDILMFLQLSRFKFI